MTNTRLQLFTLVAAAAMSVAFVSQAFAQISPERRAAIIKCTMEAAKQVPGDGGPETHEGRYLAYEACMAKAGQLP